MCWYTLDRAFAFYGDTTSVLASLNLGGTEPEPIRIARRELVKFRKYLKM